MKQELNLDLFFQENNSIEELESQIKTEHYNYIYLDPRKAGRYCYDGLNFSLLYEPFYVGLGKNYRVYEHLRKDKLESRYNPHKNNKIKKIISLGYNLKEFICFPYKNISQSESQLNEIRCISCIGRHQLGTGTLLNRTPGGDHLFEDTKIYGSPKEKHPLWNIGHSDEAKKKISENHTDCSGANNSRAKKYLFIDPVGIEHTVHGTIETFVIEHNLCSMPTAKKYCDKGKITFDMIKSTTIRNKQNLIGWEFRLIE